MEIASNAAVGMEDGVFFAGNVSAIHNFYLLALERIEG
jgi:hypothetical protein